MYSFRLIGGCGLMLTSGFLLAPLQAELPLSQAHKDKIKQFLSPNQHWLPHSLRAWNQHGIPPGNYEEVQPTISVATLPGVPTTEIVQIAGKKETLLGKIFRLSAPAVKLDHIRLDQAGLAIQEDGQVHFTARLYNQGGKQKELLGNNVTVVLRAYAGQNSEGPPSIQPRAEGAVGGPVVWEKSLTRWLPSQEPQMIDISPASIEQIRRNFSKITGFEVTLAYEKGR